MELKRKPPGEGDVYTDLNPKKSVMQTSREETAKFLRWEYKIEK